MSTPSAEQQEQLYKELDTLLSRSSMLTNPHLVMRLDDNLCIPLQFIYAQQHIINDLEAFKKLLYLYPKCLLNFKEGILNPLLCKDDILIIIKTTKDPKELINAISPNMYVKVRVEPTGDKNISILVDSSEFHLIPLLKVQSLQFVDAPEKFSYKIVENSLSIMNPEEQSEDKKPKLIYKKGGMYNKDDMLDVFLSMRKSLYFPFSSKVTSKTLLGRFVLTHPNIALECMKLKSLKAEEGNIQHLFN